MWGRPDLLEGDHRGEQEVVLLVDVEVGVGFEGGEAVEQSVVAGATVLGGLVVVGEVSHRGQQSPMVSWSRSITEIGFCRDPQWNWGAELA